MEEESQKELANRDAYVHLMASDYVAECITVFHRNGAAIDRIRTDLQAAVSLVCISDDVSIYLCLQCFDAVGWAAGRASGL